MESKLDFTYDKDLYKGLPEFVEELHGYGMKYIVILVRSLKIIFPYSFSITISKCFLKVKGQTKLFFLFCFLYIYIICYV